MAGKREHRRPYEIRKRRGARQQRSRRQTRARTTQPQRAGSAILWPMSNIPDLRHPPAPFACSTRNASDTQIGAATAAAAAAEASGAVDEHGHEHKREHRGPRG
eukprot:6200864-Pleurochrysis_carterae.AAC.4